MVDCDWIGSCIPNEVTPSGSTGTTSAGGAKGESVIGWTSHARAHRKWEWSSLVGRVGLGPARRCLRLGQFGVPDVGLIDGDGRRLDGDAGHLGPHGHVGTEMFDGLEAPDRPAEL